MAVVKPFRGIRPNTKDVCRVAALPYDVYNRIEAKEEVEREPLSFLAIDRAETAFPDEIGTYEDCVYKKARNLLDERISGGTFITEEKPCYYIYELTMDGRSQTGIAAVSSIDDYLNQVIKKHENTREEKELDRIRHVDECDAQTGPIFLAYRGSVRIDNVVDRVKTRNPVYDFVSNDGIGHKVWIVDQEAEMLEIENGFQEIPYTYIADGHHRAASAVKVGLKRRKEHPEYTGEEPFQYFLSVLFPADQLMILPYNRVIKDLNGMSAAEFIGRLESSFDVVCTGETRVTPGKKEEFGMYLDGKWYRLNFTGDPGSDPVKSLDVSILQDRVLGGILGIHDPRTDHRIDFIGGIRGLEELEKRVKDDMAVAFSMFPTSIEELLRVADAGLLMPPKSTWFEPKLRSGLFINRLS